MPLDGTTIAGVVNEISVLIGGRVDKIAQPEPDEIVLSVRSRGVNYKLLFTVGANAPRLGFISGSKTSPLSAPMFCMVLRKHLSGGRVTRVAQPDFERIVELDIESMDEMGDKSVKTLLIEIMGRHSNVMLLDPTGKVIDAIKHVSPSVSSVRPILPGTVYSRPPSPGKTNPLDVDNLNDFVTAVTRVNQKIQQSLYQSFNGISPIMASEICLKADIAPESSSTEQSDAGLSRLHQAFQFVTSQIKSGVFENNIYVSNEGKPMDFSAFPLSVYSHFSRNTYESPSAMLDAFYSGRDEAYRISQKTADLRKLINSLIERCRKKTFVYDKTLEEIKDRDELRIRGELLTAYLYMMESGAESFTAENFYDDNNPLTIKLDPSLTPAENAQLYFKQYNKQKRTFTALQEQIEKNREDILYLESVAVAMDAAEGEGDITEIRAELAEQGFVKRRAKDKKNKASDVSKPMKYTSSDGFEMYVGKNNTQNDRLTTRFAQTNDIWLHTKDIAGSHVILVTGGKEPPENTLREAANLAAYYSRGKSGSQVPVDYALKKYVRKPAGAKPGYVIYDHNKTMYVTPVEPGDFTTLSDTNGKA